MSFGWWVGKHDRHHANPNHEGLDPDIGIAALLVLSPLQAAAFALVHQGLFGLDLGCSFAPQPQGHAHPSEADEFDFLRRQMLTSRNVRGSRFVDTLLGGLNYQIEHHLFPSMPRPNLRHAQPLVREFCLRHDLPYTEATLHAVGAPLRLATVAAD